MKTIKIFRLFLLYIFISLFFVSCASHRENPGNPRPNVLLITSEDNGPQLSCYGDQFCKTPNLDKLASEGFHFSSAFVTQAGCSQSRASIFTGLYPHQNGQIGLATHNLRLYHDSFPNIFSELKNAGYRTGLIGKIHVNPESAFPLDYHSPIEGGFANRDVGAVADTAYNFISSNDQPFILMVNYTDAHRPFISQAMDLPFAPLTADDVEVLPEIGVGTRFIREQLANYYNCIMRLDAGIGLLMKKLEESGKRDDTFVIYLGDHGQDIIRGKRTSYEGGTRIPLIMDNPGEIIPGLKDIKSMNDDIIDTEENVIKELVSTIDLLPTILEVAGIEAPADLPGKSLVPFFKGENPEWREHLFTEFHLHSGHNFYPQRTVRDSRYKLIHNLLYEDINPGYQFTMDRFINTEAFYGELENSPSWVKDAYNILQKAPEYELYDLENDPYEFHNLAEDPSARDILEQLQRELMKWQERTNDPLRHDRNLHLLKAELDSCWSTGEYIEKGRWYYPAYFFDAPAAE